MSSDTSPPSPAAPRRRSCLRSALAFIGFLAAATLLLILPTGFIGPVFVFGGGVFFAVFAFHYLVWGRLVNHELQDSDSSSDEQTS